jgi:DNA repair protein RadC
VVSAPLEQLNEVCGEERTGPIIHAARAIVEAALREEVVGSSVDSMDPALGRYLRSRFGDFRNERMHAIFLDGQGRYIADENVSEGTHADVVLHSRRLLARAFDLNAVRLIIAHNHPSDACSPSTADIEATRRLKEICAAVDLVLEDHLILTRSRCFSMKKGGYLLRRQFAKSPQDR